jgi:hypothetical protein
MECLPVILISPATFIENLAFEAGSHCLHVFILIVYPGMAILLNHGN